MKNSDSRLFKKVQMRGAREIDERRAYLLIRWSEAIEAQRSRWAFFNSLLRFNGRTALTIEREAAERLDFLFIFVGGIRLWLIPIPLGRMLITSFCSGHPTPGPFTVSNGLITYTNPLTYRMILGRKTNA